MRLLYILFIGGFFPVLQAAGCDYCNCYLGLNPHFKKNVIGLRYHFARSTGAHHDVKELAALGVSPSDFSETLTILEAYGQWYPVQKLQLLISVPYSIRREDGPVSTAAGSATHDHGHSHTDGSSATGTDDGFADPVVVARYQVFNRTSMDTAAWSHRLFAGAGLRLPFGKYRVPPGTEAADFAHQPGTGSWGTLLSMAYLARTGRIGLNLNGSYLFSSMNDLGYRRGNTFNASLLGYYSLAAGTWKIYPHAGLDYERGDRDRYDGIPVDNSGGALLYLRAGIDGYHGRLALHAALLSPVSQSLNMPQAEVDYQVVTGISFAFN